jgi:hypothetical protein
LLAHFARGARTMAALFFYDRAREHQHFAHTSNEFAAHGRA